jgi:hypothetical protein
MRLKIEAAVLLACWAAGAALGVASLVAAVRAMF